MASTEPSYLKELNAEQKQAVSCPVFDHIQIIAGPGTGKTKALASRVAWLMHQGIDPRNIAVVTFTNAAAKELISRTGSYYGDAIKARRLLAGTFHSLCAKHLYQHYQLVGINKDFNIADDKLTKRLLKKVFETPSFLYSIQSQKFSRLPNTHTYAHEKTRETWDPRRVGAAISAIKNQGYDYADWSAIGTNTGQHFLRLAFQLYSEYLLASNHLDFDDLLVYGLKLFSKFPDCLEVDCVLVDEFQDTNLVQYQITKCLAGNDKGLTIVGDPDQSIYQFRGADNSVFDKMLEDYPNAKVFHLSTNYRSFQTILDTSMTLMRQSVNRKHEERTLTSFRQDIEPVTPVLTCFSSSSLEMKGVATQIKYLTDIHKGTLQYKDCAILVRYRAVIPSLERYLLFQRIPYTIIGGATFWERYEIRTLLQYLRLIDSSFQDFALLETINVPPRGIGRAALEKLDFYNQDFKSSWEVLLAVRDSKSSSLLGKLSSAAITGIESYVRLILECREILEQSNSVKTLLLIIDKIISDTEMMNHFQIHTKKKVEKIELVIDTFKTLVSSLDPSATGIEEMDDHLGIHSSILGLSSLNSGIEPYGNSIQSSPGIEGDYLNLFLRHIVLDQSIPDIAEGKKVKAGNKNAVIISTVHQAKGLEWPVVFFPKLSQNPIFGTMDEERRIFFVAITRAACLLYISLDDAPDSREDVLTFADAFLTPDLESTCFSQRTFPLMTENEITNVARLLGRKLPSKLLKSEQNSNATTYFSSGFKSGLSLLNEEREISNMKEYNDEHIPIRSVTKKLEIKQEKIAKAENLRRKAEIGVNGQKGISSFFSKPKSKIKKEESTPVAKLHGSLSFESHPSENRQKAIPNSINQSQPIIKTENPFSSDITNEPEFSETPTGAKRPLAFRPRFLGTRRPRIISAGVKKMPGDTHSMT